MSSRPLFAAVAASIAALLSATHAAAWEPTKPVEIVVAAGAGGASDQMARMMQAAIQKNNLMKQPVVVTLKGGASGAEALIYMKSNPGDTNKVLLAYSLIYMLPLSAKIPFDWRELTPVAVTALDEFVLWTSATLPYKNTKEFIDAAKKADPPFKMGGTGSKREDHVLTVFMEKKTGAKFAYLPYKSGGEAATQLVGNHTASNVNNPSENLEVWRAGQVRPLCLFSKERIQYKSKVAGRDVVERHPHLPRAGPRRDLPDAARVLPPGQSPRGGDRLLRGSHEEDHADVGIQGLHGEAGAQARLPHRRRHGEVPRAG
jgi:tripartite-type tricarboxylate transporter receptor subunit TctC